jgi:hypothetical protein
MTLKHQLNILAKEYPDFKSLILLKRTISFDLKARALAPEN